MKHICSVTSIAFAAFVLLSGLGCDDGNGQLPTNTNPDNPPATTSCGTVNCAVGQYCQDPTLAICQNGCLTDSNCASNQTCQKTAGATTGACVNKVVEPPTPTGNCDAFCSKSMACNPSITAAQCEQVCAGLNDTCKSCIAGANCASLDDETACQSECGAGPPPAKYEHLLDSCAALCQGDLSCVKAPNASGGDDGICTKQCGTVFDCDDLEGLKGIDTWECSSDISGAAKACVPFGWPE